MPIPKIIFILSCIAWYLPAIKNKGTEYFYFFLAIAVADPAKVILTNTFHVKGAIAIYIFAFLFVAALLKSPKQQKLMILISLLVIPVFELFKLSPQYYNFLGILFHFAIVLLVAIRFIEKIMLDKSLNLFLILFLTYEMLSIVKRVAIISFDNPIVNFYLTGAFQILFAIVFAFININTINYKLVKDE